MSTTQAKKFPVLYGNDSKGKCKFWEIEVIKESEHKSLIKIKYGYTETNKPVEATKEITKGKNIGKKNETSVYEQAISEATSKWTKKNDDGMKPQEESQQTQQTQEIENMTKTFEQTSIEEAKETKKGAIYPMLALNYKQRGKDINFPCYVQPKLDGVRCIYNDGQLSSRRAKVFPHLTHITKELQNKIEKGMILDGELYSDELDFQTLVGLVKKVKIIEGDISEMKKIKFVVYDNISTLDYEKRLGKLKTNIDNKFEYTKLLETETCETKNDIKMFHDKYTKTGYEGLIIRNKLGGYQESYRSKNLQKYKEFVDEEYEIVGFTDGTGVEKNLVIWTCKTKSGNTFQVRPKGTHDERRELFQKGNDFIGKLLTVVYQELTNDGIPRFPTTLHGGKADIRDYE